MYYINLLKKYLTDKFPILHNVMTPNHGILPEEVDEEDHIMGATAHYNWKVLKPNSDWSEEANKMINEVQKGRYFDTMGCTGYGLMNAMEMVAMNKWGETWNLSDRFINKMSGTSTRGNTMKRVLETVRNEGVVNEADWDWDRDKFSWNDYYASVPEDVKAKGKLWLKKYTFGYDGVWVTKATLLEALKYSPLYVGGYSWYKRGMYYVSVGNPNHVFTVINSKQMLAYDSYQPYIKNLSPDYKLFYVRRIYLERTDATYNQDQIDSLIKRGLKYIMDVEGSGEIYELTDKGLKYISSNEARDLGLRSLEKAKEFVGVSKEIINKIIL